MVRTANKAPKTTSKSNSNFILSNRAGLTLIEILIVLAIIAMVVAMGLPAINNVTYQKVNSTTRQMVGVFRTIRTDAILLNNIYRFVIDFEKKAYWVESQREFKMLDEATEEAAREAARKKKKRGAKDEEPPSNFSLNDKFSKKPVPFPQGVAFEGILKEQEGLITEGRAYIHFFPNGYNEQAILYINKDGSKNPGYSLFLRPTLGKVDLYRARINNFAVAAP